MSKFMHILCTRSSSQPCKPGGAFISRAWARSKCGKDTGSKWTAQHGSKDALLCGDGMTGGEPEPAHLNSGHWSSFPS